jgi:hypothetical protein
MAHGGEIGTWCRPVVVVVTSVLQTSSKPVDVVPACRQIWIAVLPTATAQ